MIKLDSRAQLLRLAIVSGALAWAGVIALVALALHEDAPLARFRSGLGIAACLCAALGLASMAAIAHLRVEPPEDDALAHVRRLARRVERWGEDDLREPAAATAIPEIAELERALDGFRQKVGHEFQTRSAPALARSALAPLSTRRDAGALTRSGMFEAPEAYVDPLQSGEFGAGDMVSRLDPANLRWIDSSATEQQFLGWSLEELRGKSFLDIVHPDDRNLALEQFRTVLAKGEAHGLIYRIFTAKNETKAIELNVSARYGPDLKVIHLRCHITDVTDKLRAERELRRRTRELMKVNDELRKTNRELAELKDRYGDLYQNAPAMYFSLDDAGRVLECNNTLLRTLGFHREDLIGSAIDKLVDHAERHRFAAAFTEFLAMGFLELEISWRKANGDLIDVWVMGTAGISGDGKLKHSRCVAQDVTARRALEAELHEKNERLADANEELSRKNRELDEFTYVVSHDLQEPLRTLIAFSDFLLQDAADKLDENAREHIRFLVEASKRMRALINDLLTLSRAGRVTGDFNEVNLETLIQVISRDLAELLRSRGASIRVVGHPPLLWGDRDRIGQLLGNLISNGLKYNRSLEPWVEISAQPADTPGWVIVSVRDNGIGIEPQFHQKIFQIFRRLHTREEYEGTGAGLAICMKIVQAHGGRIWVESEPGNGATFRFTLPVESRETQGTPRTEVLNVP